MQAWIIEMMNQFGYLGVAGLIALENIFPPIPSEVILTFGGFMTTYTTLGVWGVIAAATVGSVIGAIVLYGVGRFLKPDRLKKLLAGRLGRILRLDPDDIDDAIAWFNRKGYTAVFFCRFIPGRHGTDENAQLSAADRSRKRHLEHGAGVAGGRGRRVLEPDCGLYGYLYHSGGGSDSCGGAALRGAVY